MAFYSRNSKTFVGTQELCLHFNYQDLILVLVPGSQLLHLKNLLLLIRSGNFWGEVCRSGLCHLVKDNSAKVFTQTVSKHWVLLVSILRLRMGIPCKILTRSGQEVRLEEWNNESKQVSKSSLTLSTGFYNSVHVASQTKSLVPGVLGWKGPIGQSDLYFHRGWWELRLSYACMGQVMSWWGTSEGTYCMYCALTILEVHCVSHHVRPG